VQFRWQDLFGGVGDAFRAGFDLCMPFGKRVIEIEVNGGT
jgi:hypothetical protein